MSGLIDVRRYIVVLEGKKYIWVHWLEQCPPNACPPRTSGCDLIGNNASQMEPSEVAPGEGGPDPMTGGLVSLAVRTCVKH